MRVVNVSEEVLENVTSLNTMSMDNVSLVSNFTGDDEAVLYPIEWVIPVTAIYAVIFVSGLIGNVSTCVVIKRNMSLHTVTNYYLFSIAISDLLLLISGLPPEMYRLWSPATYVFGETLCVLQGFAAETSANATVLTITAFTVERYIAICHPFLSHTMSNLSRAIKFIITIWIISLCLAAPQAILFGVEYEFRNGVEYSRCTVVSKDFFQYSFLISTLIFFVLPMTIITFLYILIGIKLSKSRMIATAKRSSLSSNSDGISRTSRAATAQKRVIKMLVIVTNIYLC
ncbi:PREDICTED: neuromedin-U receptor 2-like, partial [Nicrophorus vespilloides]|uniref:Neuromedin-U receptor 2-like n=1 Tax=Nicrophorus vespilloides TaxID=110193 RepID=A0ABM1M7K5_NICVS